jgi:uncharacterized protein (TIGR03086 family)
MSDVAARFRKVAARFTDRAKAVSEAAWDNPSPCEGWVARDIDRHMVAWMPRYVLGGRGIETPKVPSVDDDPVGAWETLSEAIQSALDDPAVRTIRHQGPDERWTLEQAVAAYGIGDVLIHTWDLARATGQDETLDADEVERLVRTLSRPDARVLENGHFAPSVEVSAGADEQTKLLALTGRRP